MTIADKINEITASFGSANASEKWPGMRQINSVSPKNFLNMNLILYLINNVDFVNLIDLFRTLVTMDDLKQNFSTYSFGSD